MPRDLEYLYRLFIHGPLSSAMLHNLVSPAVRRKETTERLKIMRRKPNCLVEVPKQSREAHNANYQPLMYKITNTGVQVLLLKGRIPEEVAHLHFILRQNYRTFHHDALAAYITASIELGGNEEGIKFFGWDYIFTHPKTPQTTKQSDNPLRIPYKIDGNDKFLVPDALFAIETKDGKTCFALEADMHNEPIDPHELNRSSYGNKLTGYLAILEDAAVETLLNLFPKCANATRRKPHAGSPTVQVPFHRTLLFQGKVQFQQNRKWDSTRSPTLKRPTRAFRGSNVAASTFEAFGAGYAPKGILRGRLAIPLHSRDGVLLAYCGRTVKNESPILLFPSGFDPHSTIFNAHRATEGELYLVRDPLERVQGV